MSGFDDEFEPEIYAASIIASWEDYAALIEKPLEHRTFWIHFIYSTMDLKANEQVEVFENISIFLSTSKKKEALIDLSALQDSIKILQMAKQDSGISEGFNKRLRFEDESYISMPTILTLSNLSTLIEMLSLFETYPGATKKNKLGPH